ncbi:hypothetical protein EDD69_105200 [Thermolongibacillus altinsuensis]|uniref:Uncharacterized protein n=1 Tax=Thermolongibacillus altinsuensis TaxID=575256 RepID=A0A4R1QN32_9BACL|nr:hypothetical protein [Thermolongibacillus altinsuensis]TCL50399.1 hypothetical protein EDD69_105200 [Thermolongibacillus altinsuensis]GMB08433.1 hypothetical protein B1no1_11430 [Thermolongibacillus altinsuensis]
MSLKLIELQVALPKTHDVGKLQEQLQYQGQIAQQQLALDIQKKDERMRQQVTKAERSEKANWQKDRNRKKTEEKHPYKGTFIDFIG